MGVRVVKSYGGGSSKGWPPPPSPPLHPTIFIGGVWCSGDGGREEEEKLGLSLAIIPSSPIGCNVTTTDDAVGVVGGVVLIVVAVVVVAVAMMLMMTFVGTAITTTSS